MGKSTASYWLANEFAQSGKKTLLVEIGDRSFFSHFLSQPIHYQPTQVAPHFEVAHWSAQECLKSYAMSLLKVEALYRLFFENPVTRSLIQVAPSLAELSVTGQITSAPRNHGPHGDHEILVIDAYASGHFLGLIKAPEAMGDTIQLGPMGEQSREIHKIFKDSGLCHLHIVTTSEELPVSEGIELQNEVSKSFQWPVSFILNRFVDTHLDIEKVNLSQRSLMQKAILDKLVSQKTALQILKKTKCPIRNLQLVVSLKGPEDLNGLKEVKT